MATSSVHQSVVVNVGGHRHPSLLVGLVKLLLWWPLLCSVAMTVYFYLGLAWLLAPAACWVIARQQDISLTEAVAVSRAKVGSGTRGFTRWLRRAV